MANKLELDPYHRFSKAEWAQYRDGEPMTLSAADIERLRALTDPISLAEAEEIYLPLLRVGIAVGIERELGFVRDGSRRRADRHRNGSTDARRCGPANSSRRRVSYVQSQRRSSMRPGQTKKVAGMPSARRSG